jgi:hypothetical protein
MNIYQLIEYLEQLPNKELTVIIAAPAGYFTICREDSGPQTMEDEEYFLLNPCYGHGDERLEDREISIDDFDIDSQLS